VLPGCRALSPVEDTDAAQRVRLMPRADGVRVRQFREWGNGPLNRREVVLVQADDLLEDGGQPLVGWAAGRPFAWVDDEITGTDREWVRARHPGLALLHCADPLHGLAEDDYAVLGKWLRNVGSALPC